MPTPNHIITSALLEAKIKDHRNQKVGGFSLPLIDLGQRVEASHIPTHMPNVRMLFWTHWQKSRIKKVILEF
jgi:hypothetical protein